MKKMMCILHDFTKLLPYPVIGFILPFTIFLMTSFGLGAFTLSYFIINPIAYLIISIIYGLKNKFRLVFPLLMGAAAFLSISILANDAAFTFAPIYTAIVCIVSVLPKAWRKLAG